MKNLLKALAKFQQEVPILHKDSKGIFYTYTDLPEIIRVITPYLKSNNLGFTQLLEGSQLKTIIFHTESGEMLESSADIPSDTLKGMNQFQILGSAITYMRRYSLSSALGLVTDKDLDATSIEDKLSRCETESDLTNLYNQLDTLDKNKFKDKFSERKKVIKSNNQTTVNSAVAEKENQRIIDFINNAMTLDVLEQAKDFLNDDPNLIAIYSQKENLLNNGK